MILTFSTKFGTGVFVPIDKKEYRPVPDWLRHFRPFLWNHWTEFNVTWPKKQDLNVFYQVCDFRPIKKQDVCPGLWLAETFSTTPKTA